jgi:hypothetical protein
MKPHSTGPGIIIPGLDPLNLLFPSSGITAEGFSTAQKDDPFVRIDATKDCSASAKFNELIEATTISVAMSIKKSIF